MNTKHSAQRRGWFGARRQDLPLLRRQLPPEEWPIVDRQRWDAACAIRDPLAPKGRAAHLSLASKKIRAAMWGNYLAFLESTGELKSTEVPEDRVGLDRLTRYIENLMTRVRASTMAHMIIELSLFLGAIAPDRDWSWIRRHPGMPSQAEIRASRKPIVAPDTAKALAAALDFCDGAAALGPSPTTAIRFRNGTLMAILICFALRLKNLAEMTLGKHLVLYPTHLRVVFDGTVKNQEVIDTLVPDWIAEYVRRYLDVYRPLLLGCTEDHGSVWVNIDGAPLKYTAIGHVVTEWTAKVGDATHAHAFRHGLATMLMEQDPRNIGIAASALAHRGVSSVNQVYDRSGNIISQKHWLKLLGRNASRAAG